MKTNIITIIFILALLCIPSIAVESNSSITAKSNKEDANIVIVGGIGGVLVDITDIRENPTTRLQTYTWVNYSCFIHDDYNHVDSFSIGPGASHGAIFLHPYLFDFGRVTIKVIAGNTTVEEKGWFIRKFVFPIYMYGEFQTSDS